MLVEPAKVPTIVGGRGTLVRTRPPEARSDQNKRRDGQPCLVAEVARSLGLETNDEDARKRRRRRKRYVPFMD